MIKYLKSAQMSYLEKTNGNIVYLFPSIFIKIFNLIALIALWKIVITAGAKTDMSLTQILTYAYISTLLTDILVVKSAATGWLSGGILLKLYGRPISVFGQLIAETIGSLTPMLLFFSLPMAIFAPFLGISLMPVSLAFIPSLLLCISLGFAIDFLFACLSIRLNNMNWLIDRIRTAIVSVLSGTVIPIHLLPFGLADVMKFQPFASLGGAPLSLFVGAAEPCSVISVQILWNLILWPVVIVLFKKLQEEMVSYGG